MNEMYIIFYGQFEMAFQTFFKIFLMTIGIKRTAEKTGKDS